MGLEKVSPSQSNQPIPGAEDGATIQAARPSNEVNAAMDGVYRYLGGPSNQAPSFFGVQVHVAKHAAQMDEDRDQVITLEEYQDWRANKADSPYVTDASNTAIGNLVSANWFYDDGSNIREGFDTEGETDFETMVSIEGADGKVSAVEFFLKLLLDGKIPAAGGDTSTGTDSSSLDRS